MRWQLRSQLLKMLRREDELRLSEEVQDRYALYPESWDWKWQVTDEVQRQVCEESGFADSVEEGLDLLRSSQVLFPGDEEIKQAAHYLKYNIHAACPLQPGCVVPDVGLHTLSGEEVRLHDVAAPRGMTVILAGSHT